MRQKTRTARILTVLGRTILLAIVVCFGGSRAYSQPIKRLTPADYVEIYNLYSAYSLGLDTGNGAARVATFTPDGTFAWALSKHVPETMDAVKKRTDAYVQKPHPSGMYHILMNIHLMPTAAGADGSCYALLFGGRRDAQGHFIGDPAYYVDKLVRTPDGWRFKTREVWIAGK